MGAFLGCVCPLGSLRLHFSSQATTLAHESFDQQTGS